MKELTEGMWHIEKLFMPRLNIYDISQLSSSGVFVFLSCEPALTKANAEMLVEAHNKAMIAKTDDAGGDTEAVTILEMLKTCDLSIEADGLENAIKLGKPKRVTLEYDSERRAIMEDNKITLEGFQIDDSSAVWKGAHDYLSPSDASPVTSDKPIVGDKNEG